MKRSALILGLTTLLLIGCGSTGTPTTPSSTNAPVAQTPQPASQPPPTPGPVPEPLPAPSPASTTPVISNLTANFSKQPCTRAADHLTGSALVVTFDYLDPAGDLSGGTVVLYRRYNTGRSESHSSPIPGDVEITGTPTAGQIRIDNECPLYDDNQSSVETLTLVDASGASSNSLSATVDRPVGAP